MNNLSFDIISNILSFIDIKFQKKIDYLYPKEELREEEKKYFIKKIIYFSPKISQISSNWRKAILLSQCRICKKGRYNFTSRKCVCCNHIKEDCETIAERINSKRIKIMSNKVNNNVLNRRLKKYLSEISVH